MNHDQNLRGCARHRRSIVLQTCSDECRRNQGGKSTVTTPTPAAEKTEKEKQLALATEAAKQLLLVMDTDNSGKVSKEEWMKFMSEEFDRLDVNHDGQLDVKELTQSRMRYRPAVGK